MLKHTISGVAAIAAILVAYFAYLFGWYVFLGPWGPRLIASSALLVACAYLYRRSPSKPTLLLFVGSAGLAGAHLHDYLLILGIEHQWFEFGGSDSWVLQGFFEPRENPFIAVPADVLRYTGLLVIVGVGWLSAHATEKHLTRRCS